MVRGDDVDRSLGNCAVRRRGNEVLQGGRDLVRSMGFARAGKARDDDELWEAIINEMSMS